MNIPSIQQQLAVHHAEFRHLMEGLTQEEYSFAPAGKWSAGQQLEHICRSIWPVNLAFGLPLWVLRVLYGKANRPSKSYPELVEKYTARLAAGGRATGPYIPNKTNWGRREHLLRKLETLEIELSRKVGKLTEDQLDSYVLPHPLLGKLTLREMLFFTIYHVQHHHKSIA